MDKPICHEKSLKDNDHGPDVRLNSNNKIVGLIDGS